VTVRQRRGGSGPATLAISAAAVTVVAAAVCASAASASVGPRSAGAATCRTTVTIGGDDTGLTLDPDHARVPLGDCVTFTNSTRSQVQVQVADGSSNDQPMTVPAGASADYPATVRGSHDVTVQQTRPLLPASGSGTVRVTRAAPSASPSPSASDSGSTRRARSRPSQGPAQRDGTSARGRSRRGRAAKKSPRASLPPLHIPPGLTAAPYSVARRGGGSLPRVAGPEQLPVVPTPTPVASVPSSSPGTPAAAAPRISSVTTSSATDDLALAVAGLLALGQLAALLRVLAAVDNRRRIAPPGP